MYILLLIVFLAGQPSEAWVLDSDMTAKDCQDALIHLPPEYRPLSLAIDAFNSTNAPTVAFACDKQEVS